MGRAAKLKAGGALLVPSHGGLDAVKLKDGRVLMVYDHSFKSGLAGRGVLALQAVSDDDNSATWHSMTRLEDSYPAIIQASDAMVHVTSYYTWRRHNIKHVVLDPAAIETPTGDAMSGFSIFFWLMRSLGK